MKYKKSILCILLFCICLSFSGCTKMYELTPEEEEKIVLYSSKMIAKYNRASHEGYSFVNPERIKKAEEEKKAKEEEEAAKHAEENDYETESISSFSDIMGIEGVTFGFVDYEVVQTVDTPDVAIPDAGEGNSYIVLNFTATNTTDAPIAVDLLNNSIGYKLSINDNVTAENYSTLSQIDLSTYYNDNLEPGASEDLVLLFTCNSLYVQDLTSMTMQVSKGDQVFNVKLQ